MQTKVKHYADTWKMLTSEDCVIVGVSGGADSVCLLLVLLELQKEIGFRVVATHINHGLRGADADADEAFVKRLCAEKSVPLEIYRADVATIARERKQSTEEAAREVRRDFFEQAYSKYSGTKIALAHHMNDNAETFLFRLARGTGLKGLGGMAPVTGKYIRPLLCVERREIETYLKEQGISYCTDASNESDVYTRNRIRNHIIPYMEKEVNAKTISHISETMEQMRQLQQYLEEQTLAYVEQCAVKTEAGYLIKSDKYSVVPELFQPLIVREVMIRVCYREKDIESIHLRQLQELFCKQTGRKVDLPYDMEARRVYDGVEILKKISKENESAEAVDIELDDENGCVAWKNKRIHWRVMNKTQTDGETLEKSRTKSFDCDIIKHGVSLRTRRQGDYITIHPDGRTQKLKTFFINQKVPQDEREQILLLADGNHILWIVGYRENCAYKPNKNTKRVLEIHIDEGEEHGRDN